MPKSRIKLAGLLPGLFIAAAAAVATTVVPAVAGATAPTASGATAPEPLALNPDHPGRYEVQKGDTLWSIAGRFLNKPWQWPQIWHANPGLKSPHRIYPGDLLILTTGTDGQPSLRLAEEGEYDWGGTVGSAVKLQPRVRAERVEEAVPAIPLDAIQQFLGRPYVVDAAQYEGAPYVVGFGGGHIIGGVGTQIYVRNLTGEGQRLFDVVRKGQPYTHGRSGEVLGYAGEYLGEAELITAGDPSTLTIIRAEKEVLAGDHLLAVAAEQEALSAFFPKAPAVPVDARIIGVARGAPRISQYDVVVLDQGGDDGLERGDVVRVDRAGGEIIDRRRSEMGERVQLPDQKGGLAMVFRTLPRLSFAVVLRAEDALQVGDPARNP
jgi:hypothetical protein